MASDRKFHTSVNSTDIIQQSEDGGGIKLTTDGKFIFGAKHQNVINQLTDENYNGTVDVNANNQSFIAVMNEDSHAIDVEVPIDHFSSLNTPTDNVVTATQNTGVDCSKEFDEDAKIFLTHENNYSDGGDSNVKGGDKNKYNNKNLGWGPYGGGGSTLTSATSKYLDDYWKANNNRKPQPTEQTKLIKNLPPGLRSMAVQFSYNAGAWWTRIQVATKKAYPNSGLGITVEQSMNIGPVDGTLSKEANLAFTNGYAYLRNESTGLPTSTIVLRSDTLLPADRAKLFVKQYDDIISLYNSDKAKFLTALEAEYRRYYKALSQGNKDYIEYIKANPTTVGSRVSYLQDFNYTRWFPNSSGGVLEDLLSFYKIYVDLSKKQADVYVDCQYSSPPPVVQTQQTPVVTPVPTPSVSSLPQTAEEEQDGIYDANFLPSNETDYVNLGDSDYGPSCFDAVEESLKIPGGKIAQFDPNLQPGGGGTPQQNETGNVPDDVQKQNTFIIDPNLINEINTYIEFSAHALKDYNNDIINPNTILDIVNIAKQAGIKVYVGTSRQGHSCYTTSGNLSRHMKGTGLDLPKFSYQTAPNKWIGCGGCASASAVTPEFKKICDLFISYAMALPGASRSESGNKRGILFYFNKKSSGGNHFNHIHYSNSEYYPGWKPKIIPASFSCACSDVRNSPGIQAENCK